MFLPNKIKPCQKYCLPISGFILLFLILYLFTLPSIKKINSLNQQILAERKKLEEIYQKGQGIRNSKKEYEEIKDKTEILDKIFIQKDDELEFITQLEKKAEGSGIIQNININTNDLKKENEVAKMPIEIRLQGDYFKILKYLQDIETTDFYLNIESVYVSKENFLPFKRNIINSNIQQDNQLIDPIINFNLKSFVYYYLEN